MLVPNNLDRKKSVDADFFQMFYICKNAFFFYFVKAFTGSIPKVVPSWIAFKTAPPPVKM